VRVFAAVLVFALLVFTWNAAPAFPDGAPWGAANPGADQNCATCHFDAGPILDSAALAIEGLPLRPAPGTKYELRLTFDDPDTVVAGFQLFAQMANQQAGAFASSAANVEFIGSAIRSTTPANNESGNSWDFEWHTPAEIESPIIFYIAASAANDDGSPFGDTIHFRSYRLAADRQ